MKIGLMYIDFSYIHIIKLHTENYDHILFWYTFAKWYKQTEKKQKDAIIVIIL